MGSKLALSVTAQANVSVAWRVRGSISSGVGGGGGGGHERMHRACAQVLLLLLATVRGSAADCRRAPCVDSATWMYIYRTACTREPIQNCTANLHPILSVFFFKKN